MLYQKLLLSERPYFVYVGDIKKFEKHRHPDIELNFCLNGTLNVKVDNFAFKLNKGDLIVTPPMSAHEIIDTNGDNSIVLVIVVGTTLLGEYFEYFRNLSVSELFFKLNSDDDKYLCNLLEETAQLRQFTTEFSEMKIRGNLHKICACILEKITRMEEGIRTPKNLRSVSNIEKALELVYHNYNDELPIEEIAELCGYSASNFCKIFKKITGTTFHNFLNNHRIQVAKDLLSETNVSVEEIAYAVGFSNAKTLCRVFKEFMDCSPGAYRKKVNHGQ